MNPVLAGIAPSLIRELNAKKRADSLDFGLGEPTLRPELEPFEAATRWVAENGCPYSPNPGFLWLRERIARHYAYPGLDQAANVCVTNGSQEALYLAIKALLDPQQDEVLVVEPGYPLYPKLCQMEGIAHRVVGLNGRDGFRPNADAVLSAIGPKTRMIILSTPCNPTGRVWAEPELAKLASGLLERPGEPVWVLSDEVYRELYYGDPPASIASVYPHALVANSLSKSNALTGLRLGWLIAPKDAMTAVIKVHQFITTAASSYSQVVAGEIFARPASLGAQRDHYVRLRRDLLRGLAASGLAHVPPEGAFYCFVQLPKAHAADSIQTAYSVLARTNVVVTPGRAFGACAEGWVRLSWITPPDVLEEGIRRLGTFLLG